MTDETSKTPKAPPLAGDPNNPMIAILLQIDELRRMFNNIGRGDDHVTDLIVARLISNKVFFDRLAEAMTERVLMIKNAAEHQRQVAEQDVAAPASEQSERYTMEELSTATVGYYAFDGAQGYIDVTVGEYNEDVEGADGESFVEKRFGVIGGALYFNVMPPGSPDHWAVMMTADAKGFQIVDGEAPISREYLDVIMGAVRGNYEFVSTKLDDTEGLVDEIPALQKERFWFAVNFFKQPNPTDDEVSK